jgi:hypothetical protein
MSNRIDLSEAASYTNLVRLVRRYYGTQNLKETRIP